MWGYLAYISSVGANIIILPVLLKFLPSNILGIWYVFVSLGMYTTTIGYSFQSTFARNITYALGGATTLRKDGYDIQSEANENNQPNLPLLKRLLSDMNRFFGWVSIAVLIILAGAGTYYIQHLSSGIESSYYIIPAWIIYVVSSALTFYCLSYYSLLHGRGLIKEFNLLTICSKLAYMAGAAFSLYMGYGILGLAVSSCVSTILNIVLGEILGNKNNLKKIIADVTPVDNSQIKIIIPNSLKSGIAGFAIFITTKGSVFFASMYLTLDVVAQYGLSLQVINVLATVSLIYFHNHAPQISQCWITKGMDLIRTIYSKSLVIMLAIFISSSITMLIFGNWGLKLINSNTMLLGTLPLALLFLVYLLDTNHLLALSLINTANVVPQTKATVISCIAIIVLFPVTTKILGWGILGIIAATGVVQLCYHNWKWPQEAAKFIELNYIGQIRLGIDRWLNLKIRSNG